MLTTCSRKSTRSSSVKDTVQAERFRQAKEEAERAIRQKKIFTIIGPYPALREALRSRGWVEKFENITPSVPKKRLVKAKSKQAVNEVDKAGEDDKDQDDCNNADDNADDTDDDDYEGKIQPWEENNGYYGIMSRVVKNFPPTFIWTVRANTIDYNYLNKDQMFNHFNKNGSFTTKVGLCTNLRNLSWFCPQNADEFFPRCFKLAQEEDKIAFIDDYRVTACIGLLKYAMIKVLGLPEDEEPDVHITSSEELKKMKAEAGNDTDEDINATLDTTGTLPSERALNASNRSQSTVTSDSTPRPVIQQQPVKSVNVPSKSNGKQTNKKTNNYKTIKIVPVEAIEFAIDRLEEFMDFKESNDLDDLESVKTSDESWSKFYEWFYAACQ